MNATAPAGAVSRFTSLGIAGLQHVPEQRHTKAVEWGKISKSFFWMSLDETDQRRHSSRGFRAGICSRVTGSVSKYRRRHQSAYPRKHRDADDGMHFGDLGIVHRTSQ